MCDRAGHCAALHFTLQSLQAERVHGLSSLMQFSWWQNQRHRCKYNWSCWCSWFGLRRQTVNYGIILLTQGNRERHGKSTNTKRLFCKRCVKTTQSRWAHNIQPLSCSQNWKSCRLADVRDNEFVDSTFQPSELMMIMMICNPDLAFYPWQTSVSASATSTSVKAKIVSNHGMYNFVDDYLYHYMCSVECHQWDILSHM